MHHPDIPTDQLIADYQAGASLRQLERYHYSHTQIATILETVGIPRRRRWARARTCRACGCSFHARRIYCSEDCRKAGKPL